MVTLKTYNILLVDDLLIVRHLLTKHLQEVHGQLYPHYTLQVHAVENGQQAVEALKQTSYDLAVTDLHMPVMGGFELIEHINQYYPDLCVAMVTACDVEDYIDFVYKYNVCNIIPKTTPFNYTAFSRAVNNLLTKENIFGLETYLHRRESMATFIVEDNNQIHSSIETLNFYLTQILQKFDRVDIKHYVLSVSEAVINAGVYASMDFVPKRRKDFKILDKLEKFAPVIFKFGFDEEKFAVSIEDQGGKLDKQDILYWLRKNLSGKATNDIHGRGFMIMREATDTIIVNIQKNIRTEIILMKFFDKVYKGFKPLYINQI